jgi:hypothetical protein
VLWIRKSFFSDPGRDMGPRIRNPELRAGSGRPINYESGSCSDIFVANGKICGQLGRKSTNIIKILIFSDLLFLNLW